MKEHAQWLRTLARNMSVNPAQKDVCSRISEIADDIERPVPMILHCPQCGHRHVDAGKFATKSHHTHSCQVCGHTWRPALAATVGVAFLPGFKDNCVDIRAAARELWHALGVARGELYEVGRGPPTDTTGAAISEKLGVSEQDLYEALFPEDES